LQPVLEPMQNFVASTEAMTIEWVCMSKGVFIDTGLSSFQTLSGMFPDCTIAMVSGPSLANEFAQGVPTVVSVASASDGLCDKVSALLSNHEFSVVTSHDVIGVELGGVLKNIYAMGLGYFQAEQPQGFNFIGAYLSQALLEMKIVGVAMGAEAKSFNGVSGIGDLIATALSDDSHNAKFGRLLGQGLPLAQIEDMLGLFPEGFNVLSVVMQLADDKQLQLPLAQLIHSAVHAEQDHASCLLEFSGLFS
jgi:glycerol-3-phosphate dehydrogenase (NAD(P)+)